MLTRYIEMDVPTITFQSKKIYKAGDRLFLGKSSKAIDANDYIVQCLLDAGPPDFPIPGPTEVTIRFAFARPKSHSKKKGMLLGWKETKPDTSNVWKGFEDALVKTGYILDDKHVCRTVTEKVWARDGGFVGVAFTIRKMIEAPGSEYFPNLPN
jgi:Holliday junction resolvase RusA-like endonuclease